ncbi:CD2 antigen cytoplasmic tail-binding protein 2 homolog isoform X2 [Phymastichus coffea]|uniref:CD2 antigen cytoplasmic tail-binding protein 2 homolog isoform X2 n=1 Tax=Phymastichus coffea TaxID=108790 RepID=UPI00273B65EB|nr:CD2 antigen cytoplasmic tail-binding protein 2 homolog isoform X2 [Phymastichus coffea]
MSKRKYNEYDDSDVTNFGVKLDIDDAKAAFKNSLDSDESDDEEAEERYNVMTERDNIQHPKDEASASETNTGFTAFNMKDEIEEGHFDANGHFLWKKDKEIRDNWLDNIDWLKVEPSKDGSKLNKKDDSEDSDEGDSLMFNPIPLYHQILEYLQPGETISKAIQRIGGKLNKLTTAQRWKRKKDPEAAKEDEETSKKITRLTELANELLTRTGNMDIYQESYEQIKKKVTAADKQKKDAELDMYADDFDVKEKEKMEDVDKNTDEINDSSIDSEVKWELKWSQEEGAKIHGPHTSQQMYAWANEGFFKKGAWVRRIGTQGEFHNATRIDFELYI